MDSKELKEIANRKMQGKTGVLVGAAVLSIVITIIPSIIAAVFQDKSTMLNEYIEFFMGVLGSMIAVGLVRMALKVSDGEKPVIEDLFYGFQTNVGAFLTIHVCLQLIDFILGLPIVLAPNHIFTTGWSVVAFVLSVIVTLRFTLADFIQIRHPENSGIDSLKQSFEWMKGNCWDMFVLYISFIGWYLLVIVTCGIASFYVSPYMEVTRAEFFKDRFEQR